MKLVMHPAVEPERLARIVRAAGAMQVVNASSTEQAGAEITQADCFFGKLTPELLAASQRLRWVQSPTASLEHYLFPELIAHPLELTNMRGLYNDVIAEHVLGMMLCFTRHLHSYVRQQMSGHWAPIGGENQRQSFATGPGVQSTIDRAHRQLGDLSAGIVGLGSIGREIALRLASFGMRVIGIDPVVKESLPGVADVLKTSELDMLLASSDFVIIAAPHTPDTEQMFRRTQFQAMRRDGILINIGRGAIVNLDELVAALADGEIAGAGLDVFDTEPLPAEHPLWKFPNVILTPHVAGQSPRIAERHLQLLEENVRRFTAGKPLLNVVDKQRWF
jgi:phosphoglycerate dehydrogenase-like enzyme